MLWKGAVKEEGEKERNKTVEKQKGVPLFYCNTADLNFVFNMENQKGILVIAVEV